MKLAETTIDYFVAHLFHDYLALTHAEWMDLLDRTPTEATAALDLPDTLARASMDLGKDPVFPSLLIAAREASGNTAARRKVEVSCILLTWLKAADDGAANVAAQLTRAESAAIQIAVENRLRDLDALDAWLATLPEERRSGWQILGPLVIANASPERDKTERTIHFSTTITVTLVVARHSPV